MNLIKKIIIIILYVFLMNNNVNSQNSYGWERILNPIYEINATYVQQGPNNFKYWMTQPAANISGSGNYDFLKYNYNTNTWYAASHSIFCAVYYSYYIGYTVSGYYFPTAFSVSPADTNFLLLNTCVSQPQNPPYDIRLFYSFDNGNTRTDIPNFRFKIFRGLAINPKNDSICFASSNDTIYISTNRGVSWSSLSAIRSFNGTLTINPINTNYIYAADDSLFVSSNGGTNFQFALNQKFNRIIFNFTDSSLLTISKNKFYESSDKGLNWSVIDTLSDSINYFDSDPDNESIIYAGTVRGLYRSTNSGSGFSLFNNSFSPSRNVRGICKESGRDFVYAVTEEAVYKCWNSYIVGIEDISLTAPQSYQLFQNYPNPFNPKTVISYSLNEKHFVSLKVYDVLGNVVAELVNETKRAGKYDVEFDANTMSSGLYFYSLSVNGSLIDTKRMILIK